MNNLLRLFSIFISTGANQRGAGAEMVVWDAGKSHEAIVSSVEHLNPQQLKLRFHPLIIGLLEALWTLAPGEESVMVSLSFTSTEKGQFPHDYFLFNRKPLDQVDDFLIPLLVIAGNSTPGKMNL